MDRVDPVKRALNMAAIRSQDTGPEIAVRRIVHRLGYRYRLHVRSLPGSPDLVFPSRRKVIFVHGCFWHRHPRCHRSTSPKTREVFWQTKFTSNVARDVAARQQLKADGWAILVVWECEIKSGLTERLQNFLNS